MDHGNQLLYRILRESTDPIVNRIIVFPDNHL